MVAPKLSTCQEAMEDMDMAFGFEFNGARWTFVIRTMNIGKDYPRVDVFEDGEPVGIGYLPPFRPEYREEDGPMFDGSHSTPLGGESLDGATENEHEELLTRWAEALAYNWNLISPGYRRLVSAKGA